MSPHTLADETVKTVELEAAIEPDRSPRPRPRLTVGEMQIALNAARSHAAPYHDALEGNSPVTATHCGTDPSDHSGTGHTRPPTPRSPP